MTHLSPEMRAAIEALEDRRFAAAARFSMPHEGGFVDDPDDPGGATNWGVSLAYLQRLDPELRRELGDIDADGDVDVEDIRAMPADRALEIYHRQWWQRFSYGQLATPVGVKIFDLSINMGPSQAHKLLQRAVRGAGGQAIADDGVIGPNTLAAVDAVVTERLLAALRSEAAGFYRALVAARPARGKYINGWLNRAYS